MEQGKQELISKLNYITIFSILPSENHTNHTKNTNMKIWTNIIYLLNTVSHSLLIVNSWNYSIKGELFKDNISFNTFYTPCLLAS